MRKQTFFHAGNEHDGEFQALGVVHRQQRNRRALVQRIGVGDQRRVIQEIADGFAALGGIGGGVQQFVQVAQAALRLPACLPLPASLR